MIRIIQVDTDDHIQQLRALLEEYIRSHSVMTPGVDLSTVPAFKDVDDEIAALPGIFAPPRGRFFVALDDDQVVGCVALKPINATVGELKRMYVKPGYRGQHIGWRLVETLVDAARAIGYQRLILDSHYSMTKAHRVYRGNGFKDVPPPDDAPDFIKKIAIFMELDLDGQSA